MGAVIENTPTEKEKIMNNATLANEVASMTENNDHNGALRLIALHRGTDQILQTIDWIIGEHEAAGHMTQEMNNWRQFASKDLFAHIAREFGEDSRRILYAAL